MKQRKGRMLRENCLESKKLAKATHAACNLWFRLLVKVDDYGNFLDDAAVIKTACFLWRPGFKNSHVKRLVDELQDVGLLSRYEVNGERFIHLERFEDFQELRYERLARFPRLIEPSYEPEPSQKIDGERPSAAPPRASTPHCLPPQDSPRASTPLCPPAKPSDDNKNEGEVKKKRSKAEVAAGLALWKETGIDPRRLPPEFRELCEGLYACKGGQSMVEFVGLCMDVWESGGNKIPPQFAKAAAEVRESGKQKKAASPELPELEELAWRKR